MRKQQDKTLKYLEKPAMLCGRNMTVDPSYTPQVTYKGTTLYFVPNHAWTHFWPTLNAFTVRTVNQPKENHLDLAVFYWSHHD